MKDDETVFEKGQSFFVLFLLGENKFVVLRLKLHLNNH